MDLYKIILFGIVFLLMFTGLGWAILSLIYTWTKIKMRELKEGVLWD